MKNVVAVILGGGRGTRLYPLTQLRSKPAVPLAGKYRLVDIPISNCINSGLRQIFVLSQFQSASLNRHVSRTYRFDPFSRGFVEILAAEQTEESMDWYQGTADAVRKQLHRFLRHDTEHILILSGDQLYVMDFRTILETHIQSRADITVAATPVTQRDATEFGILQVDADQRVVDFVEKPRDVSLLTRLALSEQALVRQGIARDRPYLASMGIYVFRPEVLVRALEDPNQIDFGKEVMPRAIHSQRVHSHYFSGYWEDIGTIRTFYAANIDLASDNPPIDLFDEHNPIYTRPRYLPGSRLRDVKLNDTIVCSGARIEADSIERSIIGIRGIVGRGTRLSHVVMMGADYYDDQATYQAPVEGVPLGIGPGCVIERAIIDKNARIGEGVMVRNHENLQHFDGPGYYIRDGIVIIPKNGVLPAGTVV
ncbi:MAG: glucose-1-phosphate adenylyltransferase [Deltaproteobacteria bacterium]|nr:glucose-1-phosphate adenylyltransferase [Deltaproteobacteria bacterium]